jgi:hypothetical protein
VQRSAPSVERSVEPSWEIIKIRKEAIQAVATGKLDEPCGPGRAVRVTERIARLTDAPRPTPQYVFAVDPVCW